MNLSRANIIALLALTLALLTLALWWHSNETLPVDDFKVEAKQQLSSAIDVNKKKPALKNVIKNVKASTPKEHDQLLVSPSLEGSHIDGALQSDQNNQLILSIKIRDFFDYFLSTADEIGPEIAISEIQRYANQYLPEPANTQALELLEKYLRFKQTEYQIQQTPIAQGRLSDQGAIALMRESFESLRLSRQNIFSTEQDRALFALEDSYAEHTLSTLELMGDETLNDQQRSQGLTDLEAQLPVQLSSSVSETNVANERAESVRNLIGSELDNAQVHSQLIEQGFSNQKADDVISRRQQQQDFDLAYLQYLSKVKSLDQNQANFEAQKQGLLKRFFNSSEEQTQAKLRNLRTE